MKFSDYTPSQQKAITLCGKNIIVSAGAGSGKTQVLTERVLYFIKNHKYKLDEFLILTFTNLAAGEMKERIRKTLTKEGLEEANQCDTADICTFDSYALALVKKYHFLLNVSPNVSIIDSNIIKVRLITIINDIFEEKYKSCDEEFIQMINRFCFKDDDELKQLTLKLYETASLELNTNDYLNNFINTYYSKDFINNIKDSYLNIIKTYQDDIKNKLDFLPDILPKKDAKFTYKYLMHSSFNSFCNSNNYEEIVTSFPKELPCKKPSKATEMDKAIIDEFKDLFEDAKKLIIALPQSEEDFINYFEELKPYAQVLINIVNELIERINKYKQKYQTFEFNDIAKLALNLVTNNIEVRNIIKSKLKMIMIDEYQDTSLLQEAFINQIENNNVYMVGDVKQSIYRFRNARCDIFIDKYDRYKYFNEGYAIDLNMNFRSRKEVLEDINYIFKDLMTKEYGGASYLKDHMIEFGNQNYVTIGKTLDSRHSEFIIHNAKGNNVSETEAHLIARDIINKINNNYQVLKKDENDKLKLQDVSYSDFCILMDRGSAFETYYKIFNEYQIPLFIDNDENIRDSAIVKVLTNILKLIKHIKNKDYHSKEFIRAFISVARSFLYNYKDNDIYIITKNKDFYNTPFITDIKNSLYQTSSLSFSKQFESIIFDLNIYEKCIYAGNITKDEKYLDLFLNMFNEMSKLDYTLDDFLIYLENITTYDLKINLSSTGSLVDSVKIMNIHKSKGLEFNVVYFSGLHKTFNMQESKKDFGISKQYGLILKTKTKDDLNLVKHLNALYEKKEDISEHIRLFYVALTRTKDKMIFVLNHKDYDDIYESHIHNLFKNIVMENNLDNITQKERFDFIINLYLSKNINKDLFSLLINRYYLFKNFDINSLSLEELDSIDINKFEEIYNEDCGNIQELEDDCFNETVNVGDDITLKLDNSKRFHDFIVPFINYHKFTKRTILLDNDIKLLLNINDSSFKYENLIVNDCKIEKEEIKKFTASKTLSLNSSKENIELGLKLHFILEVLDFKNPDLNIIDDEFIKTKITEFLNSKLMMNIKDSYIYKEYEFFDKKENIHGIIDLMLVYNDHIDIIDYKTKNIDDSSYVNQLYIYKEYIQKTFNKSVNIYLYSIFSNEIKTL
jgi:ATP-dependent helicase/nuclease subunit A